MGNLRVQGKTQNLINYQSQSGIPFTNMKENSLLCDAIEYL